MLTTDTTKMSQEEKWRILLPLVFTDDFIEKNLNFIMQYAQRRLKRPISEEAYMHQLDAIRTFNTYERLHQIKVPTLILHGKQDVLIPSENGAILAETIPNAKLIYFEKSAHILAEEMNEVINSVIDFLG